MPVRRIFQLFRYKPNLPNDFDEKELKVIQILSIVNKAYFGNYKSKRFLSFLDNVLLTTSKNVVEMLNILKHIFENKNWEQILIKLNTNNIKKTKSWINSWFLNKS